MIIVPAKNILFGEHSVVYPPNSAVIASNSLCCKAEAISNKSSSLITVCARGEFSLNTKYELAHLLSYLEQIRKLYGVFRDTQDMDLLKKNIVKMDDLLKLAIGVALNRLNNMRINISGFNLYLLSQVPLQSGFGSSAVFSSAVIASILNLFEVKFDRDLIFDLTMEIEGFQHLNPSGEGPAAVIYGDLTKLTKTHTGKPKIERIKLKNPTLEKYVRNLIIVHSGKPAQTTGELVNYVKQNFKIKKGIIEELERNTLRFLEVNEKSECEENEFIELINKSGLLLEKLGVVSDSAIKFSKLIRDNGGAVKMSGAGGQGEKGSGALLVYHSDRKLIQEITDEFKFKYFDIKFEGDGIRIIK